MKTHKALVAGLRAVLILIFSAIVSPSFADSSDQAVVLDIRGEAQYKKIGTEDWLPLTKDVILSEKDAVKTAIDSEVDLELKGASKTAEVVVRPNTEFVFDTFKHDSASLKDTTLLDVSIGGVLVKAEKLIGESKFEVKTPTSIVGIRGTTFEVNVSEL